MALRKRNKRRPHRGQPGAEILPQRRRCASYPFQERLAPYHLSLFPEAPNGCTWLCWQAVPHRIYAVAWHLRDAGYTLLWLPQFIEYRRDGTQFRPLFPGYGFLAWNLDRARPATSGIKGMKGFLAKSNGMPKPIATHLLADLAARGRAYDGVVDTATIAQGDRLRIVSGPFAGIEDICRWSDERRVRLHARIFGEDRPITVWRDEVEKLPKSRDINTP